MEAFSTICIAMPPEGPSAWAVIVVLQFALTLLLALVLKRNRRLRVELEQRAADLDFELERRSKAEENLRITLQSIGDAVIATDVDGNITSMNRVAEDMTGWDTDEAVGLPLSDVFRIVHMNTREPMVSPVSRVMKEKQVVGLANHTVLIAKDSSELQISDCAAPIVANGGQMVGVVLVFRDMTHKYMMREAVEKSGAQVKSILSAAPVGIGMVKERRCIWGNQALQAMTGYAEEELIGADVRLVYYSDKDYEQVGTEGYSAVERDGSVELETQWLTKDGKVLDILLGLTAINPDDLSEGVIFSAMDITERLQADQAREELLRSREDNIALLLSMNEDTEEARSALQDANELLKVAIERANQLAIEAQAANIAKSEFLANMSHEIRTPMNGIIGLTTLLLDSGLTGDQQELAATVRKSGKSLLTIVNDILDFSKIEAGHMELELLDFNLTELLKDLTAILGVQANRKNIEMSIRVEPEVPTFLCGDEVRLRQILTNLIGNAIKFTEKGGVTLHINLLKDAGSHVGLRFEVRDTGIGMAPEQLEHIFDAFRQIDASISRRYGGTGLGLTICKQLVDMMEGKIGADSEAGQGSVFWFEVNIRKVEHGESQTSFDFDLGIADTGKKSSPKKKKTGKQQNENKIQTMEHSVRVLVVEDNLVNQTVAVRTLQKMGCEATAAISGEKGLELLKAEAFELVLMDVQMPGMDGLETTRCLREWEELEKRPRIPIIAMTAHALSGDRERCIAGGMDGYITKPINISELSDAILEWTGDPS